MNHISRIKTVTAPGISAEAIATPIATRVAMVTHPLGMTHILMAHAVTLFVAVSTLLAIATAISIATIVAICTAITIFAGAALSLHHGRIAADIGITARAISGDIITCTTICTKAITAPIGGVTMRLCITKVLNKSTMRNAVLHKARFRGIAATAKIALAVVNKAWAVATLAYAAYWNEASIDHAGNRLKA